jgi:hypothetical protein
LEKPSDDINICSFLMNKNGLNPITLLGKPVVESSTRNKFSLYKPIATVSPTARLG